jgi:hypothetical protein
LTKDILVQYCDLREEVKDLHRRINNLEKQIARIEEEQCVKDTVKGGNGGIQHFVIEGFPYPEYSKKKTLLRIRQANLEASEMALLEMLNQVEEFIQSLSDSRIRRIIRFRIVDDMTWAKVSINMGGNTTDESVKKEFYRFMEENKVCPICPDKVC